MIPVLHEIGSTKGLDMANRKTHLGWGMALSAMVDTAIQLDNIRTDRQEQFNFWELGGALLVGCAGGAFADVMEPSSIGGSHHRKELHSLGFGMLAALGAAHPKNRNTIQGRLMQVLAIAHLSHLALDIKTPRGLPWIHPKVDKALGLKSLSFAQGGGA